MNGNTKLRDGLITTVVLVLVVGGIAGFGFYHDEVTAYVRLQAWNLGPVTERSNQFLAAAAKNDGAGVEHLLGPSSGDIQPVKKNGKLTSLMIPDYGGAKERKLTAIAPTPDAKVGAPRVIYLDGGAVVVDVAYRTHMLKLRWDRVNNEWKIVKLDWITGPRQP